MYTMTLNVCLSVILFSCGWVSADIGERLKIRTLKYSQRSETLIATYD